METSKKYLRAKGVSEVLACGLTTVWLYARQQKITAIHLSPKVTVFDYDEIVAFAGGQK
jgi:hypothetical protein